MGAPPFRARGAARVAFACDLGGGGARAQRSAEAEAGRAKLGTGEFAGARGISSDALFGREAPAARSRGLSDGDGLAVFVGKVTEQVSSDVRRVAQSLERCVAACACASCVRLASRVRVCFLWLCVCTGVVKENGRAQWRGARQGLSLQHF